MSRLHQTPKIQLATIIIQTVARQKMKRRGRGTLLLIGTCPSHRIHKRVMRKKEREKRVSSGVRQPPAANLCEGNKMERRRKVRVQVFSKLRRSRQHHRWKIVSYKVEISNAILHKNHKQLLIIYSKSIIY